MISAESRISRPTTCICQVTGNAVSTMYQTAVGNGDGNCCRRRPISYYLIVIAGLVSDEFAALDELHRDAIDIFRRGGLHLGRQLLDVDFERRMTGPIANADSGADGAMDVHELALV